MADFNDLKDKVQSALETVADKAKDIAAVAREKTTAAARIARLSMEVSGEKDRIKKAYTEIGRLYYESNKTSPDPLFMQLCGEVDVSMSLIEAKNGEIAELKSALTDLGVDVEITIEKDAPDVDESDFEDVVSGDEAQCCDCCEGCESDCCGDCGEAPAEEAPAEEAPADDAEKTGE